MHRWLFANRCGSLPVKLVNVLQAGTAERLTVLLFAAVVLQDACGHPGRGFFHHRAAAGVLPAPAGQAAKGAGLLQWAEVGGSSSSNQYVSRNGKEQQQHSEILQNCCTKLY